MAPKILSISSPTSQSLNISWTTVSLEYWHGVKRGYCVRYKAKGASTSNTHYVTDAVELNTTLTGLDHFTKYYVYVSAKTTPGCGEEASTIFVTLEHGMSRNTTNIFFHRPYFHLPIYLSIYFYVCLSVSQSVSVSACLSACLPAYLPAFLLACLLAYLPACLPVGLSVCKTVLEG